MNGGRQQLDEAEHTRKQQLQQRIENLEQDVGRPEQTLEGSKPLKRKAAPPDGKTA